MQAGSFNQEDWPAKLEKLGDPPPRLDSILDWRAFHPLLKVIHQKLGKSNAGRKPHDVTLMFKVLMLHASCWLSSSVNKRYLRRQPAKFNSRLAYSQHSHTVYEKLAGHQNKNAATRGLATWPLLHSSKGMENQQSLLETGMSVFYRTPEISIALARK